MAIEDEIKQLVIARLKVLSSNIRVAIGAGSYSSKQLVRHVEREDEISQLITEVEMNFLRSLQNIYG